MTTLTKKPKLVIEYVNPKSIKIDENNSNYMSEKQKTGLSHSLDTEGLLKPLIIDQNTKLVDGQHRLEQVLKKQWNEVACYRITVKSKAHRIQLQLIANRMHGKDDLKQLATNYNLLLENHVLDETALLLSKSRDEMHLLIEKKLDIVLDKLPIQNPKEYKPKSKLGQIYQLGDHRLMCGDSFNQSHVTKLLNGKTPSLLFTDPPYDKKEYGYIDYFISISEIEIFVICDDKQHRDLIQLHGNLLIENHLLLYNPLVNYGNQAMLDHRMIMHLRAGKSKFQNHKDFFCTTHKTILNRQSTVKHTKELRLPKDFITHYSIENDIIVDLFAGSGSTLFAAQLTKRICYAMENDPVVVDFILSEWNKKYSEEPKLIT